MESVYRRRYLASSMHRDDLFVRQMDLREKIIRHNTRYFLV